MLTLNDEHINVLYLSYDGLTDPLGQSQILPYLIGLSRNGYSITVLSAEKADRFQEQQKCIESIVEKNSIKWIPIKYTKRPPVISTLYDIRSFFKVIRELFKKNVFHIVHCRSYIPALVGLSLKRKYGVRFLFDMRGFWADERVDGGVWHLKNPLYKAVYSFFKTKEKKFFENADHVVSLTQSGKDAILKQIVPNIMSSKISIIPCCADLEHFKSCIDEQKYKLEWKKKLEIDSESFVLTYLGSVGTWYLVDEMLWFFRVLQSKFRSDSIFLFITKDDHKIIWESCTRLNIDLKSIRIIQSGREELPELLSVSDVSVSFIKPSFSKKASSPTKLAELFGLGIPVFSNNGVGDIDEYYQTIPFLKVTEFSEESFSVLWKNYFEKMPIDRIQFTKIAHQYFSLQNGVQKYLKIYQNL